MNLVLAAKPRQEKSKCCEMPVKGIRWKTLLTCLMRPTESRGPSVCGNKAKKRICNVWIVQIGMYKILVIKPS